jgi:hypothetical protein
MTDDAELPRDGRCEMTKFMATRRLLFGLSCIVSFACGGVNALANFPAMLPSSPPQIGTGPMDYASIAPGEALDLATPLRFKPIMGVEMGVISMSREAPGSFLFITDQSGNSLLNMNQMRGDAGAGLDTKLHFYNLFSDSRAVDIEMRYFQTSEMTYSETVTATQVIPVFFNAGPASPVASNTVFYGSRIRSFESNLVFRTPWRVRILGGFRYFEAGDDFNIVDSATGDLVRSRVRNALGGGQLGSELVLISNTHGKVWGSFKWAALNNEATGNAVALDSAGNSLVSILSGTKSSYLLDFEVASSLAITRSISIYGGYQGLIAYGVGLAPTQSKNVSIFSPTNAIGFEDTQWHGFKLGAVATF